MDVFLIAWLILEKLENSSNGNTKELLLKTTFFKYENLE